MSNDYSTMNRLLQLSAIRIKAIQISPSFNYIVVGNSEGKIQFFDIKKELKSFRNLRPTCELNLGQNGSISNLQFIGKNKNNLLINSEESLSVYDWDQLEMNLSEKLKNLEIKPIRKIKHRNTKGSNSVCYDEKNMIIFCGTNSGDILGYDQKDKLEYCLNGHLKLINFLEISSENILSSSEDGSFALWDLKIEKPLFFVNANNGTISNSPNSKCRLLSFSCDLTSQRVFLSSSNYTLQVYDLSTQILLQVKTLNNLITSMAFYNGNLLLGSENGELILWNSSDDNNGFKKWVILSQLDNRDRVTVIKPIQKDSIAFGGLGCYFKVCWVKGEDTERERVFEFK